MPVDDLQFDRSWFDKDLDAGTFRITRDMILDYAKAIEDEQVIAAAESSEPLVASPLFCSILTGRDRLPDLGLKWGRRQFHAGQGYSSFAPVKEGDTLLAKSRLLDVYEKTGRSGRMVFTVFELTYRNQEGEKVAAIRQSMVRQQ
ncbi:MAG: MaoC family dehydratase N-terminal domain-containing protein [Dehalococcoidia bacterium]